MAGSGPHAPGILMLAAGALLFCSGGAASVPDDSVSALDRDTAAIRSATQDFRSLDAAPDTSPRRRGTTIRSASLSAVSRSFA